MTQVQPVNFFVMLIVTGIYGGYKMVYSKKVQVQKERRMWRDDIECQEYSINTTGPQETKQKMAVQLHWMCAAVSKNFILLRWKYLAFPGICLRRLVSDRTQVLCLLFNV